MRHAIFGYNHAALILNYKLSYEDALIVKCIQDFRDTGKMDTITVSGKQYFWVCYSWLLEELPGLQCSNKRTLARWMDRYVENGLMEKHVLAGNRTYYRFIESALLNLMNYPALQSTTPVLKNVTPVLASTTPCTGEYNPPVLASTTIDHITNNPEIKDLKEVSETSPVPYDSASADGDKTSSVSDSYNSRGSLKPEEKEKSFGKKEKKLTSYKFEQIHMDLAVKLKKCIVDSGTDMLLKASALADWANTFRVMVQQDERTVQQIEEKLKNVFEDDFWSKQIRSAGKFRLRWNEGKLDKVGAKVKSQTYSTQQAQEEPEHDQKKEAERYEQHRALNMIFGGVEKFYGKIYKEWLQWAMPQDDKFLRGIWDRYIKQENFSSIYNHISQVTIKTSGLTHETFQADRQATIGQY